jgi:hypothetical protein
MIYTVRSRWPELLIVAICILGMADPSSAYEALFSDQAVREAYFLGSSRDRKTEQFLAQYVHHFPVPRTGPNIAEIRLDTPFTQAVERADEKLEYSALDAEQEFRGKSLPVRVYATIYFTPSYTAILRSGPSGVVLRPENFWKDFNIRFTQGHSVIASDTTGGHRIFASSQKGMRRVIGAEIYAEYSTRRISSETAKIEVVGPDKTAVETTFDLSKLR